MNMTTITRADILKRALRCAGDAEAAAETPGEYAACAEAYARIAESMSQNRDFCDVRLLGQLIP